MDEPKISNRNKTHCKRGHPLSGDNLRVTPKARICRQCNRDRVRNWYIAKGDWNPHRKPGARSGTDIRLRAPDGKGAEALICEIEGHVANQETQKCVRCGRKMGRKKE